MIIYLKSNSIITIHTKVPLHVSSRYSHTVVITTRYWGVQVIKTLVYQYELTKVPDVAAMRIQSPDSKAHGGNMEPTWGRQDPGGLHVGHVKLAIWEDIESIVSVARPTRVVYNNNSYYMVKTASWTVMDWWDMGRLVDGCVDWWADGTFIVDLTSCGRYMCWQIKSPRNPL